MFFLFFLFRSSDYNEIIHDPSAMYTFENIYETLELMFDGSPILPIDDEEQRPPQRRKLSQIISMENLIRIYGKILVNSFAIQESGYQQCSLRQIGRGVYLG